MKAAQMFGRIFIYVVSLIVMAMIFVYGYTAIKSFFERGEEVLFIQMQTDIRSAIEEVSADYGRVDKKTVSIPGSYDEVYFVDLDYDDPITPKSLTALCIPGNDYNPIICDSWKDSKLQSESPNMFLVHGTSIKSYYIGDIEVKYLSIIGYVKLKALRGKIVLRLEGVANRRVNLREWS